MNKLIVLVFLFLALSLVIVSAETESVKLEKASDRLNYGDTVTDVFGSNIDDNDLENFLKEFEEDFDFEQKMTLGGNLLFEEFSDAGYEGGEITSGFVIEMGEVILDYEIDFLSGVDFDDFEGSIIYMLGSTYRVESVNSDWIRFKSYPEDDSLFFSNGDELQLNGVSLDDAIVEYVPSGNSISSLGFQWRAPEKMFLTVERDLVFPELENFWFDLDSVEQDEGEEFGNLYLRAEYEEYVVDSCDVVGDILYGGGDTEFQLDGNDFTMRVHQWSSDSVILRYNDDIIPNELEVGDGIILEDLIFRVLDYKHTDHVTLCFNDDSYNCPECQEPIGETEEPVEGCVDNDKNNYGDERSLYVFQYVEYGNNDVAVDLCHGNDEISEKVCLSNGLGVGEVHECPYGCRQRVCLMENQESNCLGELCHIYDESSLSKENLEISIYDKDGVDRVKFQINDYVTPFIEEGESYEDNFVEIEVINLMSSGGGNPYFSVIDLEVLNAIEEVEEDEQEEVETIECLDSDGGDYFVKGVTNYGEVESFDTCVDEITLKEAKCEESDGNLVLVQEDHECSFECRDGACHIPEEISSCDGCYEEGKCLVYGYRKDGEYCNAENKLFVPQLSESLSCENHFECESNVCVSGQCVDGNLIQKILNWFRKVFLGE